MPAHHPQHEGQPEGPQARQGEFVTPREGPQPQQHAPRHAAPAAPEAPEPEPQSPPAP